MLVLTQASTHASVCFRTIPRLPRTQPLPRIWDKEKKNSLAVTVLGLQKTPLSLSLMGPRAALHKVPLLGSDHDDMVEVIHSCRGSKRLLYLSLASIEIASSSHVTCSPWYLERRTEAGPQHGFRSADIPLQRLSNGSRQSNVTSDRTHLVPLEPKTRQSLKCRGC